MPTVSKLPKPISLFVGLGNPGSEYARTRHNVGQWFIDSLTQQSGVQLSKEKKLNAFLANITNPTTYRVMVPNDFMNCCGSIIGNTSRFYRILPEQICIIHDDLDLPVGTVRLKFSGGHGGHNGLRDTFAQLGTRDFWRLRIGIGHPGNKNLVSSFVLKPPLPDEKPILDEAIEKAIDIVPDLLTGDVEKAMRHLHQKSE